MVAGCKNNHFFSSINDCKYIYLGEQVVTMEWHSIHNYGSQREAGVRQASFPSRCFRWRCDTHKKTIMHGSKVSTAAGTDATSKPVGWHCWQQLQLEPRQWWLNVAVLLFRTTRTAWITREARLRILELGWLWWWMYERTVSYLTVNEGL